MVEKSKQPITAEHAAKLIYRTTSPNPGQVGKVRDMIRRGLLQTSSKGHFTTTLGSVAAYLSDEELKTQQAQRRQIDDDDGEEKAHKVAREAEKRKSAQKKRSRGTSSDRHLNRVYRELLSDYFLAVIVTGRSRNRSQQFQRIVLLLRCLLLLFLLAVGTWVINSLMRGQTEPPPPWLEAGRARVEQNDSPEKQVLQAWIKANRPAGELLDLLPAHPRPGGRSIRARLRFQMPEKEPQIEDTVFVIAGDEVMRTESPDPEDKALAESQTSDTDL